MAGSVPRKSTAKPSPASGNISGTSSSRPHSSLRLEIDRNVIGEIGESVVESYLLWRGLQFVERNWKAGRGEIDLIFCDRFEVVFVEVKTRLIKQAKDQLLLDSVDKKKAYQLERLALKYMRRCHPGQMPPYRIDVVGVLLEADLKTVRKIEHIKAAVGQGRG